MTTTPNTDQEHLLTIANTIKKQVGWFAWTHLNARQGVALDGNGGLQFTIGSGQVLRKIVIKYRAGHDDYTVEGWRIPIRGANAWQHKREYEMHGVYGNQLGEVALEAGRQIGAIK
jgi:hypothetical protein